MNPTERYKQICKILSIYGDISKRYDMICPRCGSEMKYLRHFDAYICYECDTEIPSEEGLA